MKKIILLLISFLLFKLTGFSQESGRKYSVGEKAQGGIIFWVDETGTHGLVAAPSDQNNGEPIRWYAGKYVCTYTISKFPFIGKGHTDLINHFQGEGDSQPYAASICKKLKVIQNGITYSDWYLPTKEELHRMRLQSTLISGLATNECYWSSNEVYELNRRDDFGQFEPTEVKKAWSESIYQDYNIQEKTDKSSACRVRAIRSF